MKTRIIFFVVLLALSARTHSADNLTGNYTVNGTIRYANYLNMSASGPINASFNEGDEFMLDFEVSCPVKSCSLVEVYPLYCSGRGCTEFRYLEPNPSAGIYLQGDLPYKCLTLDPEKIVVQQCDSNDPLKPEECPCPIVQPGQVCSTSWRVHAKRVGFYSIVIMAQAQDLETVYSEVFALSVRGCGDGNCTANETYETCARDCCESECTSFSDYKCHKECDGIAGCSLAYGCDGKTLNWKMCLTNTTYLSCCTAGRQNCSGDSYCAGGGCTECSRVCDGLCESSMCVGIDPDCDNYGNSTYPCCGNNRVDAGEQCDGRALKTLCDASCEFDCTCPTTTTRRTTTTSTTEPPTTTTTTTTTTSSSTLPPTTTTLPRKESLDLSLLLPVLLATAFAAGLAFYLSARKSKKKLKKEYLEVKKREETVSKLIKSVKHEYAAKRMHPEDATKMLYKYEKELAEKKSRRLAIAKKLRLKEK
jgi:hypothetical protein